jgi:outer membrane protein TolC
MDKLETLSGQLDDLEAQVLVIKAVLDNDAVTRSQVLEAKDDIAQVNGTLERIQVSIKVQRRTLPTGYFPSLQ